MLTLLQVLLLPYKSNPILSIFYDYFNAITSFFPYFFPTELYFIPILSGRENRTPILFVFYFYFKSIFHREVYFISIFSNRTVTQSKKEAILILFYVLISVLLNKTAIKCDPPRENSE